MKEPKPTTGIAGLLQNVIDHDEALADVKRLVDAVHREGCPFLAGISFCDCISETPAMKELEKLAMDFAKSTAPNEPSAHQLIFASILLRTLKQAWQIGHKWDADSDPKLRERAKVFTEQVLRFPSNEAFEEGLFNLLKEVEDQAWMRLSEARTKKWNELSIMLKVKSSAEVVDAVRKLLVPADNRGAIINERASFGARVVQLRDQLAHARNPETRQRLEEELIETEYEWERLKVLERE